MSVAHAQLENWLKSIGGNFCLKDKLKIYVPIECGDKPNGKCKCAGKTIKKGEKCMGEVNQLISAVVKAVGGATVYDGTGHWFDEGGNLAKEPVKIIEAAHNCIDAEKIAEAVRKFGDNMNQRALSIEQGNFYIAETGQIAEAFRESFKKQAKLSRYR